MVKRQTVWLSTMMVLSLMLIGYYTMNNGDGTNGLGTDPNKPVVSEVTTPETPAPSDNSNGTTKTGKNNNNTGTQHTAGATTDSGNGSTSTTPNAEQNTGSAVSSNDWFANYQVQVDQNLSQKQEGYLAVINSNSASSDQVAQAQQKLTTLENIVGGLKSAEEQITGEGFANCVIDPIPSGQNVLDKARVYVKTKSIQATDAVRIMNIVSQQLDLPITDVQVIAHQ